MGKVTNSRSEGLSPYKASTPNRALLIAALIVISLCTPFAAVAVQPNGLLEPEEMTSGYPNGRAWQHLPAGSRNVFLWGVEAGVVLVAESQKNDALYGRFTVSGFRFSNLVSEVDHFYEEGSNIRIPIVFAYAYVVKKIKGDSPRNLDDYASALRRTWNRPEQ